MSLSIVQRSTSLAVTERDCRTVVYPRTTALVKITSVGPQGPTGASFSGSQFLNFAAIEALDSGDTGALLQWDGSLFSPASGIVDGDILQPAQTLNQDVTLENNRNGISVGPVTIASGVTITVPSGAVWAII
jgi:hypothetical protein